MQALAEELALGLALFAGLTIGGGFLLAAGLRHSSLRWSWASFGFPAGLLVMSTPLLAISVWGASFLACLMGAAWRRSDLGLGADFAEVASAQVGILDVVGRWQRQRKITKDGWGHEGRLIIGTDRRGEAVSISLGSQSGSHTLVVGATGSGKTVRQAWIAGRLIEQGHGAIVIDPKGDALLRSELQAAAAKAGTEFLEWTPEGERSYNPYAQGSESEIADKALAGEQFTEPHYLRQAQRYLGHAVRGMHAVELPVTPASLMAHMDPKQLEVTVRDHDTTEAQETRRYLDSLGDRQQKDLAGVRDRLSILAESDTRQWLGQPGEGEEAIDLYNAILVGSVVYFRLDADRRPLLAGMLAAAIISDLVTLVARLQGSPVPTVVMIDEFAAIASEQVARLFGRARSAGVSLILGTQELADLQSAGDGALREQTIGNVETVIAHRQNVPESAELIAGIAGTRTAWVNTQQIDHGLFGPSHTGRGTRTRGHEYEIHPSRIKRLTTGQAVVITPGSGTPTVAQIHHPNEART